MISTLTNTNPETLDEIYAEMKLRRTTSIFLLFALGSQFDHLIKMVIEKLGFYCLVADPSKITKNDVCKINPRGIILSGGPVSVHTDPPPFDESIFALNIPVLGICLGFQMWAKWAGCPVVSANKKEYGVHEFSQSGVSPLFFGCPGKMRVLQSHGDVICNDSSIGIKVLGLTENCPIAAARFERLYGIQFHPEVSDTEFGSQILENFCARICGAKDRFPAQSVASLKIAKLKETVGDGKVMLALSGGTDSSTVAHLFKEALPCPGKQLYGCYIQGLDRPDDLAYVQKHFANKPWIRLIIVDATARFIKALAGKKASDEKRCAMQAVYQDVLQEVADSIGAEVWAQGTLRTDINESAGGFESGARKDRIKRHHNVGVKIWNRNRSALLFELTPLDDQVKNTGRAIGRAIGVPDELLCRHPLPGPGLAVRISGEITASRLAIARAIDAIFIEELRKWKLYHTVWQAGVYLTEEIVTCTKGDGAAKGFLVSFWAVCSVNGFTAQAAELDWGFIKYVSRRITNEVPEIGSVDYRVSDKPPACIEFQ